MNLPPYAKKAAQLLRQQANTAPCATDDETRARSLGTIHQALVAGRKRRTRVWLGSAAALAAAIALVALARERFDTRARDTARVVMIATPVGKGAKVSNRTGSRELGPRVPLAEGSTIMGHRAGGATISISTGTSLKLAGTAKLSIESAGATQRLSLAAGQLEAHVAKLEPGQRFIIDTPDASVEVRGTAFRLKVLEGADECGSNSRTRVQVSEGIVDVVANGQLTKLRAGDRWPATCAWQPAVAQTDAASQMAEAPARQAEGSTRSIPRSRSIPMRPATSAASTLTEQNDLFARAVRARRSGDSNEAMRLYSRLLAVYPQSPLAQNAHVEMMRLLAVSDTAAARRQAEKYLRNYPNGFARDEAHRLLDR